MLTYRKRITHIVVLSCKSGVNRSITLHNCTIGRLFCLKVAKVYTIAALKDDYLITIYNDIIPYDSILVA